VARDREPVASEVVFLLEFQNSWASRPADCWARAETLGHATELGGAALVLPDDGRAPESDEALPGPISCFDRRAWREAVLEFTRAGGGGTLVVAGEDSPARLREIAALWPGSVKRWPTTLGPDAERNDLALRCAVAARPRAPRTRVPLWDGNYLLAPAALAGDAGRAWIEAFAFLAREQDMIDLVILAEPAPSLQRLARSLGVALRVHWIGASPLRAECLWMACASALLVGGELPEPPALVRALECAAPLLILGDEAATRSLRDWLARYRATPARSAPLDTLRAALARTPEIRAALARGAALAAEHVPERLARTLFESLEPGSGGAAGRAA